jgi:AcrR family transcriptional regulator
METAMELFAQEGYHQTTVSRIALQAGISKGLMYNYFESKEELLQAIITKGIDLFMDSFDPDRDGTLTEEEFEYYVDGLFKSLSTNQQFFRLYMSVLSQPEALRMIKGKFGEMYRFFLKTLIGYFKRTGAANPLAEARLFGALIDGVLFHFLIFRNYPLDEVKKAIINRYKNVGHEKNQ